MTERKSNSSEREKMSWVGTMVSNDYLNEWYPIRNAIREGRELEEYKIPSFLDRYRRYYNEDQIADYRKYFTDEDKKRIEQVDELAKKMNALSANNPLDTTAAMKLFDQVFEVCKKSKP